MNVKVLKHVYMVNVLITKEITLVNAHQIINWLPLETHVLVSDLFSSMLHAQNMINSFDALKYFENSIFKIVL